MESLIIFSGSISKIAYIAVAVLVVAGLVFVAPSFQSNEGFSSGSQQVVITTNPNSTPRWNHLPLTVYIQDSPYKDDAIYAMNAWMAATGNNITFSQTQDSNTDITVKWVDSLRVGSKDATGDTDLRYIDTDKYNVISNAQIELLTRYKGRQLSDVDMTNIAMHEFGHALGLEHSDVPGDIMYPTLELSSPEVKQIPSTYADFIYQVYQVPAKSDLSFYGSINSTKFYTSLLLQKYYYLNISFSVKNLGISASPQTDVAIFANGKLARSQTIPSIGPGSSYIMSLANIRTNDSFDSVELVIDASNIADELDKSNNNVTINLS